MGKKGMILAIDPGLHKCGLAWFDARTGKLIRTECVKGHGDLDLVVGTVWGLVDDVGASVIVIEEPQQFMSTSKGEAASNSGSVIKLMQLVYSIRQMGIMRHKKVVLAPVIKWKGQTPKDIVWRRLERRGYCLDGMTGDEKDAVGIGVWYFEEYENNG